MNIIEKTQILFPVNGETIVDEKINSFSLQYSLSSKPDLTKNSIAEFITLIPTYDNFKVSIILEDNEPIVLVDRNKIDDFLMNFKEIFQYYEETESINFLLEIHKGPQCNIRNIYHYKSFLNF